MIIDDEKSYGYPVMRPLFEGQDPGDLDYVGLPFEPSLGMHIAKADLDSYLFTWEYDCPVESIAQLIETGDVKAILNIHNRKTWLSHDVDLPAGEFEGEVVLRKSDLSGRTEIRLVLVAVNDVEIESDNIHEDYGFSKFTVEKHSLVGFSDASIRDPKPNLIKNVRSLLIRQR